MSKLTWDATAQRQYETGVSKGVVYPQSADGLYPAGYAWNGLTAFTESPSGAESNPIYADNIKYLDLRSAEDYGATIEAYMYPPEFADLDGTAEIAEGVRVGQQTRKPFGFTCQTIIGNDVANNDFGYKLHIVYNATASPSEKSYQTVNDSPEAITFSWELATTPVAVGDNFKPTASITIDSTKADATKLTALKDILYGTDETEPRLPLPEEIIKLFKAA